MKENFYGRLRNKKGISYPVIIWIICLIIFTPILMNLIINKYIEIEANTRVLFNEVIKGVAIIAIIELLLYPVYNKIMKNKRNLIYFLISITVIVIFIVARLIFLFDNFKFLHDAYSL